MQNFAECAIAGARMDTQSKELSFLFLNVRNLRPRACWLLNIRDFLGNFNFALKSVRRKMCFIFGGLSNNFEDLISVVRFTAKLLFKISCEFGK